MGGMLNRWLVHPFELSAQNRWLDYLFELSAWNWRLAYAFELCAWNLICFSLETSHVTLIMCFLDMLEICFT